MGMKDFIAKRILGSIGEGLDGYKTTVGGGTFIAGGLIALLTALLGMVRLMFPDLQTLAPMQGIPDMTFSDCLKVASGGIASIGTGFGMLGLGGKAEKQKAATIQQSEALTVQNKLISEQNELLKNMKPVPLEPVRGCARKQETPVKELKERPTNIEDL